jgi:KxxxW cyclic peptide radical SAM maturase
MRHNSDKPLYPAPVLAHLAITNRCNMHCKYCSVRNLHEKIEDLELSTADWKKIIDILADWGVFQIGFTGGEPTLRKDLPELIKYVRDKGCVCNLTTNGWFVDEKMVEAFKDAEMTQCQISLDSHIPEIHNTLRGIGSHERVLKSIKLLQEKGIAVGVDTVVSKNNIHTIPEMIDWMAKNNIPYLTLIKLKKGDLPFNKFLELSPSYEEYSELIRYVCSREKNENPNITLDCGSVSNLQRVATKVQLSDIPVAGCPIGHHLICVSPNGDIYPCAALLEQKFCLGNILKEDIMEIWNNNVTFKEFRLIKQKIEGKCKNCERIDICRGGCRGINYTINKDIYSSDPTCMFLEVEK